MEQIFKNQSFNYLNCRKIQVFNHLLEKGIPVKHFYYNCLESTDDVLDQVIKKRNKKWRLSSNLGNEFEQLGIKKIEIPFNRIQDVKDKLISLLDSESVFIWLHAPKLHHRTGMEPLANHSLLIVNYLGDDTFLVDDVPLKKEIVYTLCDLQYGEELINYDHNWLTYYDVKQFEYSNEFKADIDRRAKSHIRHFHDSFSFYNELALYFEENEQVDDHLFELLPYFDDAISIIAGSRLLFSQFVTEREWPSIYSSIYFDIAKKLESLKLVLSKSAITRKFKRVALIDLIQKIKSMEEDSLRLINEYVGNVNEIYPLLEQFQELNLDTPHPPTFLANSSTSIKVDWSKQTEPLWITSYEVYKDEELVSTTTLRQFTIPNLLPDRSYRISIRAIGLFGNTSPASEPVALTTSKGSLLDDLAFHKPVYSSSDEHSQFTKDNVVDGKMDSRWSSDPEEDSSWLYVDLGVETTFSKLKLTWESAYAQHYKIQSSMNSLDWIDIHETDNGHGGEETIHFQNEKGRYLKLLCLKKATTFGYSVWKLEVYP
ncbi:MULTISPECIES: discoidin domain-containing protein [unclassified Paenibacillus]|uniref:discoidin domain-containing protein n=1 Tax=unclassified Paenibacillus TaxID=185978 RepID=UPI0036D354CB